MASETPRRDVAAPSHIAASAVSSADSFDLADFVHRLDKSAEQTLAVADQFRRDKRQDTLHMEHLLVGLYAKADGPARRAFERAGVNAQRFVETLRTHNLHAPEIRPAENDREDRFELVLPGNPRLSKSLPPLSKHTRQALAAAATRSELGAPPDVREPRISDYHLLGGAFSLEECTAIRAFSVVQQHVSAVLQETLPTPPNAPVSHMSEARAVRPSAGVRPSAQVRVPEGATSRSAQTPPASDVIEKAGLSAATPPVAPQIVGTGAANDQASGEDQLGFTHYVEAFADLIESPDTRPPLVIGIFGSWGAGKSFLLTSLTNALRARGTLHLPPSRRVARWFADRLIYNTPTRRRARVYSVHFNAWEYNASETIWPRLVRRILDAVGSEVHWHSRPLLWLLRGIRKLRKNFLRKLREDWAAIAAWLVIGGIIGWAVAFILPDGFSRFLNRLLGVDVQNPQFSVAIAVGSLAAAAKLLKETFFAPLGGWVTALVDEGRSYGGEVDVMRAIRDDLDLLDRQLRQENSRVLIVVDDLDRCEPEKAIEVLQAINLLLDRGSFIVALGIDARVITAAVEKHYKDLLGPAGITGYEYLDKIVQIPFRIPEPTPADLKTFLKKQLGGPEQPTRSTPAPQQALLTAPTFRSFRELARRFGVDSPEQPTTATTNVTETTSSGRADREQLQLQNTIGAGHAGSAALRPTLPGGLGLDQPLDAAEELARYKPEQPPPPLAFGDAELAAFQSIADYLRPNPRHIKRIVNVYALVRALAKRKDERRILDDPAATVLWLALCAQWPYATREMLRQHDALEEARARNKTPYPVQAPLRHLLERAAPALEEAKRRRFDHDTELLERLVAAGDELSWDDLQVMRRYTLNFNPALESELRAAEQERRKRNRSEAAQKTTSAT